MKLILIPLVLAVILLSINLNKPFVGHHDFMSAFEGVIAKNYLKYGYLQLKFGGMLSQGSFSTHHPQLYPILISLSFSIFGIDEWSERLIPVIFSLIGTIFLFLICQKLWNKNLALTASLFFVLNPMFIYFGNIPLLDFAVLYLMLAAIFFYLQWIEKKKNKDFFLLLGSIFIAGLIDWTIVYLPPLLILHSVILRKFDFKLTASVGIALLTVVLLLVHNFILTGEVFSQEIIATFQFRLTEKSLSFGGEDFGFINYLKKEISWFQAYFTRIMLFLSGIFFIFNLNLKLPIQKVTVLILLLLGLAHPLLFSRYVYIHDFLNIYILPFLATTAALGLNMIIKFLQKIRLNEISLTLAVILIFTLFVTERIQFAQALMKTDMNKQGRQMAELLDQLQQAPNEAVVVSPRFESFYGIFTNFYSNFPYSVTHENSLKKDGWSNYKYIITIDEDIQDRDFYQSLITKYNFSKKGDWTVINVKK